MPTYAIVTIVEAPQSEVAWEVVSQRLLNGDGTQGAVSYVGAPWLVPENERRGVEYGTDSILLRIDGECVSLYPAD